MSEPRPSFPSPSPDSIQITIPFTFTLPVASSPCSPEQLTADAIHAIDSLSLLFHINANPRVFPLILGAMSHTLEACTDAIRSQYHLTFDNSTPETALAHFDKGFKLGYELHRESEGTVRFRLTET